MGISPSKAVAAELHSALGYLAAKSGELSLISLSATGRTCSSTQSGRRKTITPESYPQFVKLCIEIVR
jgi:hypothetical protein